MEVERNSKELRQFGAGYVIRGTFAARLFARLIKVSLGCLELPEVAASFIYRLRSLFRIDPRLNVSPNTTYLSQSGSRAVESELFFFSNDISWHLTFGEKRRKRNALCNLYFYQLTKKYEM